ncbi:MAG: hypothetical protein WD800_00145 [Dehalococcoidia bacterium]
MDGTISFFNSPTGRVILLGVGFITWMAAIFFAVGVAQIALIGFGLMLIFLAAALGDSPRRDPGPWSRGDLEGWR